MALLRGNGSPGCVDSSLQVICIIGSGVSHLPLDNTHRFSMGFRSGEFAGQSSTVIPWSLNQPSGSKCFTLHVRHLKYMEISRF